ncbi:MAG: bacillithiol biosynthesis cysteine-adding enzyme BshC [Roseivirga sp.]|jgi:bacillithiol biosynthesis cysteine-adding enzyme BshC
MAVQNTSKVLLSKIPFDQTNSFSKSFLDYIGGKTALEPYYNRLPTIDNFKAQIAEKSFSQESRNILFNTLIEQYAGFDIRESTALNIDQLKSEKTFTITTGHQLNIFTGPLYFIYKIVTVINACKDLKAAYPEYNFVPVYWMASEDHDFEEISYFRFNGKKFTWQTEQKGAVGRFNPKSLKPIIDSLLHLPDFFTEAYLKRKNLAESVRHYVNALFGDEGLVVLDADHKALKKQLIPVMLDDVFKHSANNFVSETTKELQALGYSTQVFPREINFFYLKGDIRARLVKEQNQYTVLDHDIHFTVDELRAEINQNPENFSPNVVLRPLYQEMILPNLAYVGGPSELVYWLQLKDVFTHFSTAFPILLPRNFAGVITPRVIEKIEKAHLTFEDIFKNELELIKEKVQENSSHNLSLQNQKVEFQSLFAKVQRQALAVDTSLDKLIAAESQRMINSLAKIEKKILKAEKKKQEVLIDRIASIKENLFPGGSPQERKDNFLNFYLSDPDFVKNCLHAFDPFDFRFHLIAAHE